MKKRILSLLLVTALLISCIGILSVSAISSTVLSVNSKSGNRGDTVKISVNLAAGSAMQACGFELLYDKNVVEVVSATKGALLSSGGTTIINTNILGKIIVSFASTVGAVTNAGSLLDVQFKIKADAPYGESSVKVVSKEMSDGSFSTINVTCKNGTIKVIAPVLEAPTGLSVIEKTDNYVQLIWNEVPGATGYNVYVNGELHNQWPLSDTVYLAENLTQNKEYTFAVSTVHYDTESDLGDVLVERTEAAVYEVVFVNWNFDPDFPDASDDYFLASVMVNHGETVEAPEEPQRPGYRFIGWDKPLTNITEDVIIQAMYEAEVYRVVFVDYDGTVLKTQTLSYNQAAEAPAEPEREGYIFTGWDVPFDHITESITVTATYEERSCTHEKTSVQNAVPSTCTKPGYEGDVICDLCGALLASGGESDLLPHSYVSVVTPPTVTAQGYTTHTCTGCGDSYVDSYTDILDENAPQILIDAASAMAGQTVKVTLRVKNNPGIVSIVASLKYDTNVLTLVSAENGELFTGFSNGVNLVWDSVENITEDGILATLTFKVADSAAGGNYQLEAVVRSCYNADYDDVTLSVQSGTLTVIDFLYGDANRDGLVNMKDVVILRQYIANYDYDTGTSSVEIGRGADANGDSQINMKDVALLRQYMANYDFDNNVPGIVLGPQ